MGVAGVCFFLKILMRINEGGNEKQEIYLVWLSRKKTSFFEKLNQTRSILLQFTQDLHLLIAYHQTKTLISRFFLLMPPIVRNGSFLFVLQSQSFYQAQLVPVTTIFILRSSLARLEEAEVSRCTKRDLYL